MTTPATVLGTGIPDALGCPFERPNNLSLLHPKLADWKGDFLSTRGGWHDLEPGQWSDDTQMTVALAEALLEDGMYMPATPAANYLHLYQKVGIRGIGGTTRKALDALATGVSPNVSGIEGAEGNGTAMRVSPIGLFFRNAPLTYVADIARTDARITHRSKEAQEGSAAVAMMVALLSKEGADPRKALSDVFNNLNESQVKDRLKRLLVEMSNWKLQDILAEFGTRGHVVQTVSSAFAAFIQTSSYEAAIMAAIRAGGDTDTTGAVTGALAGTYYGYEGIPERLRTGVDQGEMLHGLDKKLMDVGSRFMANWSCCSGDW